MWVWSTNLGVLAFLSSLVFGYQTSSLAESAPEIRIGTVGDLAINWPLYVPARELMAKDKPTDAQSFTTKLVRFEGADEAMAALREGAIHVWAPALTERAVEAYIRGEPIVIGAGLMNKVPYRLVTRSEILTVEDLRSKTIGITPLSRAQEKRMLKGLEEAGLQYRVDYSTKSVYGSYRKLMSITNNRIDGAFVAAEFVRYFVKPGLAGLRMEGDLRVLDKDASFPEFPFMVAAYNRDWVAESSNNAIVRLFTKGLSKRIEWLHNPENRTRAIDLLVKNVGVDRSVAEAIYHDYIDMNTFARDSELYCNIIIELVQSAVYRSKYPARPANDIVLSDRNCIPYN